MEIYPGIHRILAPHQNRYLYQHIVVSESTMIIIDAGIRNTPKEIIIPYIQKHDFDQLPKKYLIITHSDSDHCGGINELQKEFPDLIIMCSVYEKNLIENPLLNLKQRYLEFKDEGIDRSKDSITGIKNNLNLSNTIIDIGLTEQEEVNLGNDLTIKIINTSGHTFGHISVYIEKYNCLIMTDALNYDGVYDISGVRVLCPTYRYTEFYLKTIYRIKKMNVKLLLGSHYKALKSNDEIEDFIYKSEEFVYKVEKFILDKIEMNGCVTLSFLINNIDPAIFPIERKVDSYYCIQGGLEYLMKRKVIVKNTNNRWYLT